MHQSFIFEMPESGIVEPIMKQPLQRRGTLKPVDR
jgi:hypothetical protein